MTQLRLQTTLALIFMLTYTLCLAPAANAQWVAGWQVVDTSGNPTFNYPYVNGSGAWCFAGVPSSDTASDTYPAVYNEAPYPSEYPFDPNPYFNPDLFGGTPSTSTDNVIGVYADADNVIYNELIGNWGVTSDTGKVQSDETGDFSLTLQWAPTFWFMSQAQLAQLELEWPEFTTYVIVPPVPAPPSTISLLVSVNAGGGGGVDATPGFANVLPTSSTASGAFSDSLGDSGGGNADQYNRNGGGNATYLHLKQVSTNGGTVTVPLHLEVHAKAENDDGNTVSYRTDASGSAVLSASAVLDPRNADITSPNIDNSSSVSGEDVTDPGASDKTVDSVVYWNAAANTVGAWCADASLSTNADNFSSSKYVWTKSGDGTTNGTASDNGIEPTHSDSLFFPTPSDGSKPFGKTTTFSCNVTDLADGASEQPTYAVRWHYPTENVRVDGPVVPGQRMLSQSVSLVNGTGTTLTIPKSASASLAPEVEGAGLFFTVGGALAPMVDLAAPELAVFQAVCGAIGYGAGLYSDPPAAGYPVICNADYDQFTSAVQLQDEINNNPTEYATSTPRFYPAKYAGMAALQLQPGTSEDDPYYRNSTAQFTVGAFTNNYELLGDSYTQHGYLGIDEGSASVDTGFLQSLCGQLHIVLLPPR